MSKKRLLLLAPSVTTRSGGIENYCYQVFSALHCDNWNPYTLSMNPEAENAGSVSTPKGLPGPFRKLRFIFMGLYLALTKKPSHILVLHCHFLCFALLLARIARARVIVFTYGIEVWNIQSSSTLKALKKAHSIVSISNYTAQKISDQIGRTPDILPCTYQDSVFRYCGTERSADAGLPFSSEHTILLTIARLSSQEGYKGIEQMISSMPKLVQKEPNLRYVVGGTGDQLPMLKALAEQFGVADKVHFTGFIPDHTLVDHYRQSDLFVLPSTGEGFGIVLLEAMAVGTPVLAFDAGGIPDALQGGKLGFLVDPTDKSMLSTTILEIVSGKHAKDPRLDPEWLASEVQSVFGTHSFKAKLHHIVSSSHE